MNTGATSEARESESPVMRRPAAQRPEALGIRREDGQDATPTAELAAVAGPLKEYPELESEVLAAERLPVRGEIP